MKLIPKLIIFDFDGTLADSKNVIISVFNKFANIYKFDTINESNIDYLKTLSIKERLKSLKVPLSKIPILTIKFLSEYRKQSKEINIIENLQMVLKQISQDGYDIAILSSNSIETIKEFIKRNELDFITQIYCSTKLFKKDKLIKKVLKQKNLKNTEVIYVGDERRDIIACKDAKIQSIWVSWGLDVLDKENMPDYIANNPNDIIEILQLNNQL